MIAAALARVGLVALVVGALHGMLVGDGNAAYAFSLLGALCALALRLLPGAPRLALAVVLAGLFNAAGFGWELYSRVPAYDEVAHATTPFVLALAGGAPLVARLDRRAPRWLVFAFVVCAGVTAGALWEMLEWVTSKVWSGYATEQINDTITDLMLDIVGVVAATALLAWPRARRWTMD